MTNSGFLFLFQPSNCLVVIKRQSYVICPFVGRPYPVPSQGIGAFAIIAICLTVAATAGATGWFLVWRNPERRRWLYSTVLCRRRSMDDYPSTVYSRVNNSEVSSLLLNATVSESDDDMLI
ncbi:AGAP000998-PA-like protein [Anopheles sinensis]|uniref:AGAP000998-PA-like protein n=1 Tax=Anopheles sinensis TaxID=74873 RepID=A0A084WPP1_ANOSI|nr:AGAP000998-PA-like protein [Anopheles sinensis]